MGESYNREETNSPVIFEVEGEPAVVINGLPKNIHCGKDMVNHDASDMPQDDPVFGDLLEGRMVRKLFGGQYYCGEVVKYNSEANWYRVVYEDGDFEDLEWHELEEVLLPLDINIPLKLLPFKRFLSNKSVLESKVYMPKTSIIHDILEPYQITLPQYHNANKLEERRTLNKK